MKCPKCGATIKPLDISPNCKNCGVNIFYAQQKDLLTRDAKKSELEYAAFRILAEKIKTSFVKGKIQIFRIVAMVMAIGAIFVPFATVWADTELFTATFSFGAWGIYSAFSDGTLEAVWLLRDTLALESGLSLALLGLIVLIFLSGLGIFIALLLSFINIQKSAKAMKVLSVVGAMLCVAASGVSIAMPMLFGKGSFLVASTGVGGFVCFCVLAFIAVLNHLVIKKNIQPQIKDVDVKRTVLNKKVKSGEISLDDLPLPVFETPEEKEKRLAREAESQALVEKAKGGESLE
ncbi:MAG: zinc ribbon domain-containing protein [Clostridia bacterium]|nr:zinc ribbon domain-containing protein [Clostridia bacterium]